MNEIVYSSAESKNSLFACENPSADTKRSINGSIVGCSKCVGYCQYSGHPGFLTAEQRKQHNCIHKSCNYYLSKPKKQREPLASDFDRSSLIFSLIKQIVADEGVKVIKVQCIDYNEYTAFFVTITNEYSFAECANRIYDDIGTTVKFIKLNYDFNTCVALLCEDLRHVYYKK